ncbi:hypothetical protein AKO1_012574, partial [Acrasis kona]
MIGYALCNAIGHCYHTIHVVDDITGRGVPLVNLSTVNFVPHYTDSNGIIAFYEPDLMNLQHKVFFHVSSHGYEVDIDEEGYRGVAINIECGGETQIKIRRTQISQRLYRYSGQGIYRDSIMTNTLTDHIPAHMKEGLNAGVTGHDSVQCIAINDTYYWFFGDTNSAEYPLGNFHTTCATTNLKDTIKNIDLFVDLNYIKQDAFVKPVAPMKPLAKPTWLHAPHTTDGTENNLYASYFKITSPETRGIMKWNPEEKMFVNVLVIDTKKYNVWPTHGGHTLIVDDYVYFMNPFPFVRCPKNQYADLSTYTSFSPLVEGTNDFDLNNIKLDRSESGRIRYAWKRNTSPLTASGMYVLVKSGRMKPEEALWLIQSMDQNMTTIIMVSGTVNYNEYRKKYILISGQIFGDTSLLGNIWYSESDSPLGPWSYAVQIAKHNSIDFYNPRHHPLFDQGPNLYYEGTYVRTFDTHGIPTPYYDYNQQVHKLNLDDIRLFDVPNAVYKNGNAYTMTKPNGSSTKTVFLAHDRMCSNCVEVRQDNTGRLYVNNAPKNSSFAFYAKTVWNCKNSSCRQRSIQMNVDGVIIHVFKVQKSLS